MGAEMDNATRQLLKEIEQGIIGRFGEVDKRFEDARSHTSNTFAIVAAFVTGIFTIVAVIGGLFSYSERSTMEKFRDDMNKFQADIRAEVKEGLGKIDDAELEFVNVNDFNVLAGQEVPARLRRNPPKPDDYDEKNDLPYSEWTAIFQFALRNTTNQQSGQVTVKLNISDPFVSAFSSTSKEKGQYELVTYSSDVPGLENLPGGMTKTFIMGIGSHIKLEPGKRYPIFIEAYYGRGKKASSSLYIVTSEQMPSGPKPPTPEPRAAKSGK